VNRSRPRVAILGGGAAGLAAAWRLSEPGWRDRFDAITVYQRGWRLGGKGASSRGEHGRIEEHGLHIWLGYYENAFRLLRECYEELDRSRTDPQAPIRAWREAMIPAPVVGLEEHHAGNWCHWVGDFATNEELPGEPDAPGGTMSVTEFLLRALRLLGDFLESLPGASESGRVTLSTEPLPPPAPRGGVLPGVGVAAVPALLELVTVVPRLLGGDGLSVEPFDQALRAVREELAITAEANESLRRSWHLVSVVTATLRGIVADGLLGDPRGFRRINDED
jgi:hypothetical protein